MRVGNNPVKESTTLNVLKEHRIIMVFFVPVSDDDYFSELDQVLDKSLYSIFKTINVKTTALTLINNSGANPKIDTVINKYKNQIDKYVCYNENKGKVYAVLNEVRGVFEEFVTITDGDILFFDGWENEVFSIFKNFPRAGVVSPYPSPYTTFHFNQSVFGFNSILGQIKYGKHVSDDDIELYKKGTNLPTIDQREGKKSWKEKQYLLQKSNHQAIIGAYHVVSTYRTSQFKNETSFPEIKFKNSYENNFIDCLADKQGLYRLSTIKSYMYHIGNTVDDVCKSIKHLDTNKLDATIFSSIKTVRTRSTLEVFINRIIGRIFIKFKWNNK